MTSERRATSDRTAQVEHIREQFVAAGLPVTRLEEGGGQGADGGIPPEPDVPERFSVRDEGSANWVVRKVKEARAYVEHVEAWAAAEIRTAQRQEQFFLRRFGHQLQAWLAGQIGDCDGRRKSFQLPAGTVGLRARPPRVEVTDYEALISWCRERLPEALTVCVEASGAEAEQLRRWQRSTCPEARLTQQVSKTCLMRHLKDTGEKPTAAGVARGPEESFIK